jgi:CheY-like chemotaxis protein
MAPALESRGHVVRALTSPTEALRMMESWTPDLIISDILMPEMDGLAFARLTRRYSGVTLMFVSIAQKQAEAVVAGAAGYVQKPATVQEVRQAVERVLGRRAERNVILVVDDDDDLRAMYRMFLEPRFEVLEAVNGRAGLKMMLEHSVDLVLVDIHMPVMNGVELIRAMRATPSLKTTPVIVQTSDRGALASPVWDDLDVSILMDKHDFVGWVAEQIDAHLGAAQS